jgi:hypothetical protein
MDSWVAVGALAEAFARQVMRPLLAAHATNFSATVFILAFHMKITAGAHLVRHSNK